MSGYYIVVSGEIFFIYKNKAVHYHPFDKFYVEKINDYEIIHTLRLFKINLPNSSDKSPTTIYEEENCNSIKRFIKSQSMINIIHK